MSSWTNEEPTFRRVLIRSVDRVSGNPSNFRISLPYSIKDAISEDWTFSSIEAIVTVDRFCSDLATSSSSSYWRYCTIGQNSQFYPSIDAVERHAPSDYNSLQVSATDSAGAPISVEFILELIFLL